MPELSAFRVGLASPANTFFAIWMAKAAGLYEAYGLDVEIVPVVGGSQSGPDLDSGRIHLMHIGMSSVVRANSMGHDLVTIGSLSNIIRNSMFAAPGINNSSRPEGRRRRHQQRRFRNRPDDDAGAAQDGPLARRRDNQGDRRRAAFRRVRREGLGVAHGRAISQQGFRAWA